MKTFFLISLLAVFLMLLPSPADAALMRIESGDAAVVFEEASLKAASEVVRIYPSVRDEVLAEFSWKPGPMPTIALVTNPKAVSRATGADAVVAYANPSENLIVLDLSRTYVSPLSLKTVLKHEACHLLMAQNVGENAPRWAEEGVCQWMSERLSEALFDENAVTLSEAVVMDDILSLRIIDRNFPNTDKYLALAYDEGLSAVEFIVKTKGKEGLERFLSALSEGKDTDAALRASVGMGYGEFDSAWQEDAKGLWAYINFFGRNLYALLFAAMALLTVVGFCIFLRRKRIYQETEEEAPEVVGYKEEDEDDDDFYDEGPRW